MNIVNVFKPLTFFVKCSISDDLQGSEYGLGKSLLKVKRRANFGSKSTIKTHEQWLRTFFYFFITFFC